MGDMELSPELGGWHGGGTGKVSPQGPGAVTSVRGVVTQWGQGERHHGVQGMVTWWGQGERHLGGQGLSPQLGGW